MTVQMDHHRQTAKQNDGQECGQAPSRPRPPSSDRIAQEQDRAAGSQKASFRLEGNAALRPKPETTEPKHRFSSTEPTSGGQTASSRQNTQRNERTPRGISASVLDGLAAILDRTATSLHRLASTCRTVPRLDDGIPANIDEEALASAFREGVARLRSDVASEDDTATPGGLEDRGGRT